MTYLEALKARTRTETIGFQVTAPRATGSSILYVAGELHGMVSGGLAQIFQPGLTGISSIIQDGAPGTPSRSTSIRLSVVNKPMVDLTDGIQEVTESLRQAWIFGARIFVYHLLRHPDGTWYNELLFEGEIRGVSGNREAVTLRASNLDIERILIPNKQVLEESMVYGGLEGERPKGASGNASPIFYGRFHTSALDSTYDPTGPKVPWAGEQGEVLAPAIGIKIPMIPLVTLSDRFRAVDSTAPLSDATFLLMALGDLDYDVGVGTDQEVRLLTYHRSVGVPPHQDPLFPRGDGGPVSGSPAPYNTELYLSRVFTWNKENDSAVPFGKDQSSDQVVAEAPYASVGDWGAQHGDLSHTASTSVQRKVQTPYIARTDPDWGGTPPGAANPWSGTIQSLFLTPEKLTDDATVTDTIQYGTTAGVLNPLQALDRNMATFATIPGGAGNILSVQLPATGPNLGEVIMVRVGILCSNGPSRDVRLGHRFTPNLTGDITADWHTTQAVAVAAAGTQIALDPAQPVLTPGDNWGAGTIYRRHGTALGHGPPQWNFSEADATTPPRQHYAGDLAIWTADGLDIDVYAVWMEVVFRPSNLPALARRLPGTEGGDVREKIEGSGRTFGSVTFYRYENVFVPYSGNLPEPELKKMNSHQVYMTGHGPKDVARYQLGESGFPFIERAPGIALHALDKYADAYDEVERTPGAFGSFHDANALLETLAGGTTSPWTDFFRLSVIQVDRISLRKFLDKLGEHARCHFIRQASGAGHKWRCFVDTSDPAGDAPERLFRDTIKKDDFVGGLEWDMSGPEVLRNHFTLRYGYHHPSRTYAYEKTLSAEASDLTSESATYVNACDESQQYYGTSGRRVILEDVIELPWLWSHHMADMMLKWHCAIKFNRRVLLKGTLGGFADLKVGHYFQVDDDLEETLGVYPGLDGTGWSGRWFSVVSSGLSLGSDDVVTNKIMAVEVWSKPTTPLP